MITINRINSLVSYWLLFNSNNNINDFTIDYIVEKYYIIFNKKIVNSNDLFEFFSSDKKIQDLTFSYCKYWRIDINELMKDDNFGIFIFTIYFCVYDISVPTPYELMDKYKLFFGDIKHINNKDNTIILHEILRNLLKNYKNLYPNIYRDIELKMKLNKLINM